MYKEPAWPFPCLTTRTGWGKLTKVSAGKVGGACVLLLSFCPRLYHWVSPCQILQPYLIFIFIVGHKFSVQNNLEKGPSRDHFWFKRRVLHGFLHTSFHQLRSTMINKLRNKSRPLLQFLPKPNFSHRSKQSCEKKLWGQTVNSLEKERESTGERAHSLLYAGAGRGCGPGPARGASKYTSDLRCARLFSNLSSAWEEEALPGSTACYTERTNPHTNGEERTHLHGTAAVCTAASAERGFSGLPAGVSEKPGTGARLPVPNQQLPWRKDTWSMRLH